MTPGVSSMKKFRSIDAPWCEPEVLPLRRVPPRILLMFIEKNIRNIKRNVPGSDYVSFYVTFHNDVKTFLMGIKERGMIHEFNVESSFGFLDMDISKVEIWLTPESEPISIKIKRTAL